MKKSLLFLIFFPKIILGQVNSEKVKGPSDLDSVTYDLSAVEQVAGAIKFSFSKIEVIDARFDTSKLGFTFNRKRARSTYKDFKKIKLAGGVPGYIERFYNDRYRSGFNGSDDKLLILIKKLWIDNIPFTQNGMSEYDLEHQSYQDVYVKFEYCLHRGDGYYPLIRIDTIFRLADEHIKTFEDSFRKNDMVFFNYILQFLIEQRDFNGLVAKAPSRRKFSIDDINKSNQKRFFLPILTAVKYNNGVYSDGNEFINNNPSHKEFTVNRKGHLKTVDGEKTFEDSFWGFTDSSGLHKTSAKNMEIFRVGNSFEFFSKETVDMSRTVAGLFLDVFSFIPTPGTLNTPGSINQSRIKTIIVPRQLDMETGKVY